MRTWVLLLFCVVVIAAVANAQKQGNGAGKEDREKGKKVEGKEVKKDGKINRQKSNGNGNRERNKLEKANNRERNSKKNEGKDGKGPQKAKDRTIKNKSERDPKNKRPRNGGKIQNKPKKVGDRNKSLKKKEDKSSKQLKKTKSKQDCPGECVAEGDCQGRSKRGMMCDDDQVCCLPKRNRAVKKGTSVKRFCKPLSLCSDMEGECRKKKQGCNLDEKRYKNKKNKAYCDKKSCYCCVKQCKSRGKCLKQGGTCMLKKASKKLCAGDFVMGKNYCDGKKCGCCIPGGPSPSCKQKKTCTKEGGECVPLGSSCSGEIKTVNSNGKNYCKGSCGCCLEDVLPPVPPTDAPPVPPTDAPPVPPTDAPPVPPTDAPPVPPTDAPPVPPTEAPPVPPTDAPPVPPTEAPPVPPTDIPPVPPTDAPSVPPTDAPPVPTSVAPPVPTTDAPPVPPTDTPPVPTTIPPTVTPPANPTTLKPTTTAMPPTTVMPTTPPPNPTTTPPNPTTTPPNPTTTAMPTTPPPNPTTTVKPTTTPPNPTTTVKPTPTTVMPTSTTVMPTTTTVMPTMTTAMPTTTANPTTTTVMPTTTTVMPTTTTAMPTTTTAMPTTTSAESSTTATSCSVTRAYCPDCGVAQVTADGIRVVNGTAAAANEYPYQVIVAPNIAGSYYQCGGSIIKKRWILTAAHCFFDRNENQAAQNAIQVGYGSSNRREVTYVNATRYVLHENYTPGLNDFDIALIELPSDLNYESDATIQPICLAEASDIVDGGKAVATGWGALQFQGSTTDDLQEVVLDIISTTQCQSLTGLPSDTSSVVCALTAYKDTCQGDSGGPLVVRLCPNRWAQIGIVSYGVGCANPENPGVYTRVPSYRTWIDTNTGSSTTC